MSVCVYVRLVGYDPETKILEMLVIIQSKTYGTTFF